MAEPRQVLLTCDKLVIGHDGRPLVPAIDLEIRRGTFLAVLGRNGAGKTTFFRTLLGLQPPVAGSVTKVANPLRTAYVPQTTALDHILPLESRDIVLWGGLSGWSFLSPRSSRAERERADAALVAAKADALAKKPYSELSKGQKQRVLLARVLGTPADMVLLDEPTAAMDVVAEKETMGLLTAHAHQHGLAVVLITHDLGAARYADQVLFIDRDDQAVVVSDGKHIFEHPAFHRRYGGVDAP